jgi:hypothetical protein
MNEATNRRVSSGWRLRHLETGEYILVEKIDDNVNGEGYSFTTGNGAVFVAASELEAIYAKRVTPSFVNSSAEFPTHGSLNLEKYKVVEVREIVEELQISSLEQQKKFHLLRDINVNVIDGWEEYAEFGAFKKVAAAETEQMVIELKKTARVDQGDFCFRSGESYTYFEVVSLTDIGDRHYALLGYRSMGNSGEEEE